MLKQLATISLGLLIPAAASVIAIYQWLAPDQASLVVYIDEIPKGITFPQGTRQFLNLCTSINRFLADPATPEHLTRQFNEGIKKFSAEAKAHPQNRVDARAIELFEEGLALFTANPKQRPFVYYDEIVQLRIVNLGSQPAQNLTITMHAPGGYEVGDGHSKSPEQEGYAENTFHISTVNGNDVKYVTFWPEHWHDRWDDLGPKVQVAYAGHNAEVINGIVPRRKDNFVIELKKKPLLIAAGGALTLAGLSMSVLINKRRSAKRA